MQTFKLYTGTTKGDVKLMKFMRMHISDINLMGVKLSITHLKKREMTSDIIEALNRKGISRLPVLIANRKKFVGVKKILKLFNNNFDQLNDGAPQGAPAGGVEGMSNNGGATDLESYMMGVMDDGDEDRGDNETDDMMQKYARNSQSRDADDQNKASRPSAPSGVDNGMNDDMGDMDGGSNTSSRGDGDNIMGSLSRTSGGDNADMDMEESYWANQESSDNILEF